MFNTLPFFQTDPTGKPADDVGIFIMFKLFTNVEHTLVVVILEPTINEQLKQATLFTPPKIAE